MLTRREFLKRSGLALAGAAFVPSVFTRAAAATNATSSQADNILVVVQMGGGNDGLNTIVPFGLDGYRAARPSLGLAEEDVLPLTDQLGLHPEMGAVHELYEAGRVAIIQGVGYPNPSLSHFRSMEIWHTAAPDRVEPSGWLASYLRSNPLTGANPMYAVSVLGGPNRAMFGSGVNVPSITSVDAYQLRTDPRYPDDRSARLGFLEWLYQRGSAGGALEAHAARTTLSAMASSEQVRQATAAYSPAVEYPRFPLANSLMTVAQLMAGGFGTRVYYVAFGGFDTHANQPNRHRQLLAGFSSSVAAFLADVAQMGKADQVLLLTFSEFGRRVAENASQGTDHGTAGPMLAIGGGVRGGIYGEHPSLTDLANANLRYGIDFRSVYGTVLERWLGADQHGVLGARYEDVGFL